LVGVSTIESNAGSELRVCFLDLDCEGDSVQPLPNDKPGLSSPMSSLQGEIERRGERIFELVDRNPESIFSKAGFSPLPNFRRGVSIAP